MLIAHRCVCLFCCSPMQRRQRVSDLLHLVDGIFYCTSCLECTHMHWIQRAHYMLMGQRANSRKHFSCGKYRWWAGAFHRYSVTAVKLVFIWNGWNYSNTFERKWHLEMRGIYVTSITSFLLLFIDFLCALYVHVRSVF